MSEIRPLTALSAARLERLDILKRLASASRQLAELKGVAASMPNQGILISTLGLQEAKDSSAIENIVTTHDELFRDAAFPEATSNAAAKEVAHYRQALRVGFEADPLIKMALIHHQFEASIRSTTAMAARVESSTCYTSSKRACSTYPCCT